MICVRKALVAFQHEPRTVPRRECCQRAGTHREKDMRIAIIGAGISGLTCAWLLRHDHEITVFEAERRPGGHSNTVEFRFDRRDYRIDTGFIVCNDRTYPNFLRLLAQLGIEVCPTTMSFSVRCDRSGFEYCGSGLNGMFAQRRNLLRPSFLRMAADILRFNRHGMQAADSVSETMTVAEFLRMHRYGRRFVDQYLLPMGAAIWSCPTGAFSAFPIRFILEFYRNHGLLSLTGRPQWYTIPGGSRRYVERMTAAFPDRIEAATPVRSVRRTASAVIVATDRGEASFDEVILACHSDQALGILENPSPPERTVLSAFPYDANEAILHSDIAVLPHCRTAWSAWNYRIRTESEQRPAVSYCMNILQHIESPHTFCVTLNDSDMIDPATIISRHTYSHPVFTVARAAMQAEHTRLIRSNRTSFCGAYWGNGFHEAGVNSALAVCRKFGISGIDHCSGNGAARLDNFPVAAIAGGSCA